MSKQVKFITSHRSRVKRAEEYRRISMDRISIFDREALVEFYLLEDILRLYEWRLSNEQKRFSSPQDRVTRAGLMAKQRNIEKFTAVINIFRSAIDIAEGEILAGNYKAVWSSVPEHALMVAANSTKHLPQMRELAIKLLKTLSEEALAATEQNTIFNDDLDALEDHEANVRGVKGLPKPEEIDELIRAIQVAIPDENQEKKADRKNDHSDTNIN